MVFESYCQVCRDESKKDISELSFKSNPNYTSILEHVKKENAQEYLKLIRSEFSLPNNIISKFTWMNDKLGKPNRHIIESFYASPSNFRYLYHALRILKQVSDNGISQVSIIEIGAGYGGLCLALNYLAKNFNISISKYVIIDLPEPLLLLQKYLGNFSLDFPVEYLLSSNYENSLSGEEYFLVSGYTLSSIDSELCEEYLIKLLPKCSHGFMVWNKIDIPLLRKNSVIEDERPQTGNNNKYINF